MLKELCCGKEVEEVVAQMVYFIVNKCQSMG